MYLLKQTLRMCFYFVVVLISRRRPLTLLIHDQNCGSPLFHELFVLFLKIIQLTPMPVVQTNVHTNGATTVHSGSSFPVSMATVMAPGAAPPQTVLLTSPPTRSVTPETQLFYPCFYFALLLL